jgi:cytidylate kinase
MNTNAMTKGRLMSEAAERQMRTWALTLEAQQRLSAEKSASTPQKLIQPFITISRECGVDAGEIAALVADKCGCKLLDRELLDELAENLHLPRIALEFVDEKTASWFHEMFGKWLDKQLVTQAEYVSRLGRIVLLAAQHEPTIFVGRGAQFLLPRGAGLTVRIIAPSKNRIQRVVARSLCSRHEAVRFIQETDKGRADFVHRYFHADVANPELYDMVVNLEHMSREMAAELIVRAYKSRFMSE